MSSSRAENSIRNVFAGAVGQVLNMALSFVVRTVFIHTLTETYLGINGLLTSVLSMLNLANLGIDGAIIFAMYKPVAEKDTEKTKSLLRFYRNAYRIIGWVILIVGFGLTPLLPYLAKGSTDLVDLRIIYWLFLLQTVMSYWFFAYLTSIVHADQRRYIITQIDYVTSTVQAVAHIALLWLLKKTPAMSFYVYTALGVVVSLLRNLLIRYRVCKLYPWVRDTQVRPLPPGEKAGIYKNVVGMFTNNVCRVLNDGIDSTIISAFLGLAVTGVYSNYLVIKSYVLQLIKTILDPLVAGVGNLCAVESVEKKESFFYSLQFFCFWLYGFCAICFWTLFNSFIAGVWLRNTKWLLSGFDVLLLTVNFLIEGLAKSVIIYRDANGLYWQTKFRYVFSSVFNALFSIVLVGPLGLGVTGALLGTTASVVIMISYDPVLVYREVFKKSAWRYYWMYLRDLAIVMLTGGLVHLLCLPFSAYTVPHFLLRMGMCLVIPNSIWYIMFRRDPRFAYLRDTALGFARKAIKKLR